MKRRSLLVPTALAGAMLLVTAGCSSDGGGSGWDQEQFDGTPFTSEVYGDLEGDMVYHDGSGGLTLEAIEKYNVAHFEEMTGVSVDTEFNSDSTKFFAAAETGNLPWSAIAFPNPADFEKAKAEGLLAPLNPNVVPLDVLEDGQYDEYGIPVQRYTANIAYNTDTFPAGTGPTSAADFFDTEKFPGKRCLMDYPVFASTLELPLIADGVDRDSIYPLDVDRSLAKLDTIKDDIVWYSDGDSAIRYLTSGECDMGTLWNGRGFNAIELDDAPIEMSWTDAMYTNAIMAVPADAPNPEAGQAFIASFLDDIDAYVGLVNMVTYTTPFTDPAIADKLDPSVVPYTATGDNLNEAYELDATYYADELDGVLESFNRWLIE